MPGKKNDEKVTLPPAGVSATTEKRAEISAPKWLLPGILVLTALLYNKALTNDLIWFDDNVYILENPFLRNFSLKGIGDIFTSFYSCNYHPLTTLTYFFEFNLFGENPIPYHLLNVLLHLLNTWLVYKLAFKLSGSTVTGTIVCLLFAIHPMHVESVAWVAERKDVLYTAFYLASLLLYLRYLSTGLNKKYYVFSLLLFIASLLSKSAAVTLPVLLIVIDYYKGRKPDVRSLLEKAPFFALSLVFGIVNIVAQSSGGAINNELSSYSLLNRFFLFTSGIAFYLVKLVAPVNLCALHYPPVIKGGPLPALYYGSVLLLGVLAWLILRPSAYRKELLFGSAFFIIALSVMLPVASVGFAYVAERYTYVAYIGLFYIIGQLVTTMLKRSRFKNLAIAIVVGFSFFCCYQAWNRIPIWKDALDVFTDAIDQHPDDFKGYWMRGSLENNKGMIKEAFRDYSVCLSINPSFELALHNRAYIYTQMGDTKSALADYTKAIAAKPLVAENFNGRGTVYYAIGDTVAAMNDYNRALQLNPKYDGAYCNRGILYADMGATKKAMDDYNASISVNPSLPDVYNFRGEAYLAMGDTAAAMKDYNRSISLNPQYDVAYYNRAVLKVKTGALAAALGDYNTLLQINTADTQGFYGRAVAKLYMKDTAAACADWRKAVEFGKKADKEQLAQYCH